MNPVDRAHANWRRVVDKVKPIGKGLSVPGANIMMEKHWLEMQFMNLRIGDVQIISRIHRNSIPKGVVRRYLSLENRTIGFNAFVQEAIDSWSEEMRARFLKNIRRVKYFSEEALSHLTVTFADDGSISMPDFYLAHWFDGVREDKSFENFIRSVRDLPPKLLPEGEYICVLNTEKEFRIAHKVGETYHSSLSLGRAVLFSGKIYVTQLNGKNVITLVNLHSGHYRLNRNDLYSLLEFLKEKGVDTDALHLDINEVSLKETEIGN